ncbi:hypothetical protein [Hamadaea tsunoensis]|uniref:hypothetical protein n=1 Tax=Hamadaea tsunoensis TaxID=53368 RepID=UPI0004289146|nr:hypothetical protein [Hamadaea tsunoensis]
MTPGGAHAWIRPGATAPAEPRWGHADGLQIGLDPALGPRGLIRVFAPYLDHPHDRLVNFIAVEPLPVGATDRGYSELEFSELDGVRGKRFWSLDDPAATPGGEYAAGVVDEVDGVGRLTVYIGCERFANGAEVRVRARFRADRPHEVALAGFRLDSSVPLDRLYLSATMGNWARLRRLHLAERVVTPAELWPGHRGDGFTEHARFPLSALRRTADGAAVVTAEPDEPAPTTAAYADGTDGHWRYVGRRAVQGWRAQSPGPDLEVLVNGRYCYWASQAPIPGGTSYENFELGEPFRDDPDGQEYAFTVEPLD